MDTYDYDKAFGTYHTSRQMAEFLMKLYDSDSTLGIVDRETFQFELRLPMFPYANSSMQDVNTLMFQAMAKENPRLYEEVRRFLNNKKDEIADNTGQG